MTYDEQFIRDMGVALRERSREKSVQNFDAGEVTRLNADWPTSIMSPTAVLQYRLSTLRARSRGLAMNNDYARRFLWMVSVNVIGPQGITLQCKSKFPDGKLDKWANDRIEEAWTRFGKKGNFDVTGQVSMIDGDRMFTQSTARDGECITRIVEGFDGNPYGFAVQYFEPDHLDESLNVASIGNGNQIRMGVEFDKWFRPVAYHLLTDHPGDSVWSYNRRKYIRVPADQIIHSFIRDRFNQPRGVPWMHSAMTRLNNIGAYEEAEIIAARIGASSMGIWERDEDADPTVVPGQDGTDGDGTPIMEMEPGIFTKAPKGYHFKPFDVQHPAGNFGPFMKSALRGISSGLLVSYNSLASDLEGVNYSSIRQGVLEERDCWKVLQGWAVENYKAPIYRRWLRWMLLNQHINLPLSKLEKFSVVQWQPRTWSWVDPEKDINATVTAIENGLTSRSRAASEAGMDFEELLTEIKQDEELMQKYGVKLIAVEQKKAAQNPPQKQSDTQEEDNGSGTESRSNQGRKP